MLHGIEQYANREKLDPSAKKVLKYFGETIHIPSKSKEEQQVRNRISKWAEIMRFRQKIDKKGNLAVYVPSNLGANQAGQHIVLQGHMDAVTLNGNDKNPTEAEFKEIDGRTWIVSKNETTLTADNKNALGIIIAIAENHEIPHDDMTLIFTVEEEIGLKGAQELDPDLFEKPVDMIFNLDGFYGPDMIAVGCAGSKEVIGEFDVSKREAIKVGYEEFELKISGLPGGHSGIDIHQPFGNAIHILANFLLCVQEAGIEIKLTDIFGGSARNAIPKEATAKFAMKSVDLESVRQLIFLFKRGLAVNPARMGLNEKYASEMKMQIDEVPPSAVSPLAIRDETRDSLIKVIREICTLPLLGVGGHLGGIRTSSSLGLITSDGAKITINTMVRSNEENGCTQRAQTVSEIYRAGNPSKVDILGMGVRWREPSNTKVVELARQAVRNISGKEVTTFEEHAGLEALPLAEAAAKKGQRPSVATFGPIIEGAHSDSERMDPISLIETYNVVAEMLRLSITTLPEAAQQHQAA